jgi:hypothetical protein
MEFPHYTIHQWCLEAIFQRYQFAFSTYRLHAHIYIQTLFREALQFTLINTIHSTASYKSNILLNSNPLSDATHHTLFP